MKLKVLDLFAGIGGFSYGLESTGHFETVGFCEMDKFCQKVLAKNFPNIKIYEDVRSINGKEIKADVVTGGFPCQGFSQAGKQRGTSDERYLWPEMFRVISEVKPRWVIGENVQGIINIENGMVLRQVHNDLESEGFEVQCFVIPASGKGAWHQRNRVWIIAHSDSNRKSRCSQYVQERSGELGESHVSHTNNDGYKKGQSETCYKIDAREDNTSLRREGANNISGSGYDRGDKTKSRIDESIPRSHNGNQKESTTTKGLYNLSEKSDKCDTINQTSADKENNNRTLVQERQMFQLSESRGLGDDKTSPERNQIRSRDDNTLSHRMDTNHVFNSHNQRLQEHELSQKSEEQKLNSGKLNAGEKPTQSWWQTQSKLCGVPNGVSYELDKDRANRIKSLGNSIVPLIARELGLAIMKAELDETR